VLGKYLDPVGNRDLCGPQNPAYAVLKFPGLSSWLGDARCHE